MSNPQHPRLFIETPIDQTEGLENDYYRCFSQEGELWRYWNGNEWMFRKHDNYKKISSYLRPLPEGTVAVSEEELRDWKDECERLANVANHWQTKYNELLAEQNKHLPGFNKTRLDDECIG